MWCCFAICNLPDDFPSTICCELYVCKSCICSCVQIDMIMKLLQFQAMMSAEPTTSCLTAWRNGSFHWSINRQHENILINVDIYPISSHHNLWGELFTTLPILITTQSCFNQRFQHVQSVYQPSFSPRCRAVIFLFGLSFTWTTILYSSILLLFLIFKNHYQPWCSSVITSHSPIIMCSLWLQYNIYYKCILCISIFRTPRYVL